MEVIILAGGLGTRLREVVRDVPKPMAPICGKPFLAHLLDFLAAQRVERVIFSIGYKGEIVRNYFGTHYREMTIDYALEPSPLGTGGGIVNAMKIAASETPFIINGDTFFKVDLNGMRLFHLEKQSLLTMAVKPLSDCSRYGAVVIDKHGRITAFREKADCTAGLINGGVYCADRYLFQQLQLPTVFSFENDFIKQKYLEQNFYALLSDSYFVDIGVPEDYKKAVHDLSGGSFVRPDVIQ